MVRHHPSRHFIRIALSVIFLTTSALIGKDGGEKLRVNDIPDLAAIYAVIDGMPMRGSEMSADPGRC
jgi:hypothetical protein